MKKKIIVFLITFVITEKVNAQIDYLDINISQSIGYDMFEPFGVGKNSGNNTLNFGDVGIYFNAFQARDNKIRYRYSNYQPMAITGAGFNNEISFLYSDGSQGLGYGKEWTSMKSALRIRNLTGQIIIGQKSKHNSHSDFLLSVDGKIVSKGVVVSTNNWADYVFKKDYMLPKLSQVEKFIKSHGHLPNIPSEKEIVESGIDLKEIIKLQQEKIEELFLYIIQIEKKMNSIQKCTTKKQK